MDGSEALWRDYKENGSADARSALITEYVRLAKYVVDRLNVKESGSLSHDDLVGHAIVGLIDAIERYDPVRGVKFETYAITRIRGAVVDMLRSLDWVPRSLRRTESMVRTAYANLERTHGRPASDEEVAAEMGVSLEEFHHTLSDIGQASVFSLDDCLQVTMDSDTPLTLTSILSDAPDPAALVEISEQRRILAEAIAQLPERERLVISLYYYEGLTLKEIGQVLEVTEARISQIHTKAMLRLSGKLERVKPIFCG